MRASSPPDGAPPQMQRLGLSLAASALVHGLVLVLALRVGAGTLRPPRTVIPVALVGMPGGGEGAGGAPGSPEQAAAAATAPEPARRPVREERRVPRPQVVARGTRPPSPAPSAPAAGAPPGAEGVGGAGGAGDGTGGTGAGGEGSGGDGSGGVGVAYGTNPLPPYPLAARRLGQEGVVLLEVLVAPDGSATDVQVSRSSGFPLLDHSAASTVRGRWRFVPARRGGTPVATRVRVPIRFRLDDARS